VDIKNNEKKYKIHYRRTYKSDCYHVNDSVVFECMKKNTKSRPQGLTKIHFKQE